MSLIMLFRENLNKIIIHIQIIEKYSKFNENLFFLFIKVIFSIPTFTIVN